MLISDSFYIFIFICCAAKLHSYKGQYSQLTPHPEPPITPPKVDSTAQKTSGVEMLRVPRARRPDRAASLCAPANFLVDGRDAAAHVGQEFGPGSGHFWGHDLCKRLPEDLQDDAAEDLHEESVTPCWLRWMNVVKSV